MIKPITFMMKEIHALFIPQTFLGQANGLSNFQMEAKACQYLEVI